jgi:hypothetical protein
MLRLLFSNKSERSATVLCATHGTSRRTSQICSAVFVSWATVVISVSHDLPIILVAHIRSFCMLAKIRTETKRVLKAIGGSFGSSLGFSSLVGCINSLLISQIKLSNNRYTKTSNLLQYPGVGCPINPYPRTQIGKEIASQYRTSAATSQDNPGLNNPRPCLVRISRRKAPF